MFDTGFPRDWSTLKKLLWLKVTQAAAWVIRTVTGTAPITLTNAVHHAIHSLTQYGKVEQRNLPPQYTQTEYIQGDGSSGYVNTGIVINSIDTEVEVDYQFTETTGAASPSMAWGYMGNSSNLPRWGFGAYGGKWLGSVNQTAADGYFDTSRHKAVMRVYMDGGSPMWDGTLDGVELYTAASLPNPTLFTNNTLLVFLFARNNNGTAGNFAPAKIYAFKVRKAGVLVNNLVPCKTASAVGFYDTVTGNFLTGTGLSAGADSVPTPSAPMDIVTNNGKIVVSRNLCNVISDNIVVGKYINNSGVETSDVANFFYAPYVPVTPGGTYTMTTSSSIWYFSVMQYDSSKNFLRRSIWGATNTPVGTEKTFDVGADCAYIRFGSNMKKATITESDVLAVNWMLTQTATAQDYRPYGEIYIDGTPETLTVSGKNLLDPSAVTAKKYINASGQELPSQSPTGWLNHSDYIRVTVGEDYTLSVTGTDGGSNTIAFNWFDANKTILATRPTQNVTSGTTAYTFTNTAPSDAAYLIVNFITGTKVMVEESSTATVYEPYVTPQTVNDVPMLLSVGDYKDEDEIISGIKTVRIGVIVLTGDNTKDGTWGTSSGASNLYSLTISDSSTDNTFSPISTHFVGRLGNVGYVSIQDGQFKHGSNSNTYYFKDTSSEDVTAFKAKLAAQYAAGTPVIVIYPLATEQTEQGTPHALHTAEGDNVVDVTANVSPVELEVEFTQASA